MVALKAAAAVTLLFALQGALAVSPADISSSSSKVRSAKHEQRQAAQKPPVLQAQPSQIPDPTLAAGNGNGKNQQFITGQCTDSTDCGAQQSDLTKVCCASVVDSTGKTVGTCSGSAVGNAAPKLGCGFGDGKLNSGAGAGQAQAQASGTATAQAGGAQATGAASNNAAAGNNAGAAAASGGKCPAKTTNDSLGPGNVGVAGKQFVTGQCTSDGNCASKCCVLGGGTDKSIAVCRNQPALKPTEKCGFSCTA